MGPYILEFSGTTKTRQNTTTPKAILQFRHFYRSFMSLIVYRSGRARDGTCFVLENSRNMNHNLYDFHFLSKLENGKLKTFVI